MDYNFYIKVFEDGKQLPSIGVPLGEFEFISELANDHLLNSTGVNKEIGQVNKVANGEILEYSFATSDWCMVEVHKNNSIFINGFDEYKPYKVTTSELLHFLTGWRDFLIKYERNQIPGLVKLNSL